MISYKIPALFFLMLFAFNSNAQIITTYAGTGFAGYSGDGGQATSAQMYSPYGLAVDDTGNLYVAERINNIIRKITPAGIISTFAGTGVAGYSGDGGPAVNAKISFPYHIVAHRSGDVYFTDYDNHAIRKVNTSGIISTVRIIVRAPCPTGGMVTVFHNPSGITFDGTGNLYFAIRDRLVLKKNYDSDTAKIFAGDCAMSYTGDGGPATLAALNNPLGLAYDNAGNIYISDNGNNVVRRVDPSGIITRFAGNGFTGGFYGDGGPASAAGLFGPVGVATDASGNLYIQDIFNRRIRKVDYYGTISTLAGNGIAGYSGDGGPATAASFHYCTGLAVDMHGNCYISDLNYSVIRKVTPGPISLDLTARVKGNTSVLLYPNPNKGTFGIMGELAEKTNDPVSVYVLNMLGQVVYRNTIQPQGGMISARVALDGSLPPGVYILNINGNKSDTSIRFNIEK